MQNRDDVNVVIGRYMTLGKRFAELDGDGAADAAGVDPRGRTLGPTGRYLLYSSKAT